MSTTFALPDLGEGIGEAEVVNWLVDEGEAVAEDQPVVEVETDKAVVDVPSPVDGTVAELLVDEGDTVAVGADIVVFEVEGDGAADAEAAPSTADEPAPETGGAGETPEPAGDEKAVAAPRVRRLARELGVDIAAVRPAGEDRRITERDVLAAADEADEVDPAALDTEGEDAEVLATPHARKIADDLGVDLAAVSPSRTVDGEAYVSTADVEARADASPVTAETDSSSEARAEEREAYRGIRRTIGEQMERSRFTAPHATTLDEVLVDDLVEIRADLADVAADEGVSLTYTPFIVKAVTAALEEYPYLNASLDEEAEEIVKKYHYDVGVAIGSSRGLVVPVIRDADRKGLLEIAAEIGDFADRAESGDLEAAEMQGGTFTVTNIGMVGGEYGTPVINYPEVAILSIGTVKKKPRVVDDEIVPRQVMPLSLSIDHRVVDGITAVEFLNAVAERLHEPGRILIE